MILKSKLKFVTYIPVKGSKSILIKPTVNNISEADYDRIKDVDCFKEYVESGQITVMGKKEKPEIQNADLFEGDEQIAPVEIAEDSESYVDVILRVKPAEAIEIIKSTVVKKDLENALVEEKRPRVKKVIRDQLKSLEIEQTEEDSEEKTEDKGMFVD